MSQKQNGSGTAATDDQTLTLERSAKEALQIMPSILTAKGAQL